MKNWLQKKSQFVYIRRYETELPAAEMRNFFDDVAHEFPGHTWKSGQGLMRCDGEICGWYLPLSKATMLKSIPFPNVDLICFDEFIIETGVYRYLSNEVRSFLECYSTISRDRDVKAVFLSNAITFANPYFIYFEISLEEGQKLKLTKDISLEYVENEEFKEHQRNTRFGRLISKTEYGDYAIENKFILDNETFIAKLPGGARYMCTIVLPEKEIGVYKDDNDSLIYMSDKLDNSCKLRLAVTQDAHNERTSLVLSKSHLMLAVIIEYFSVGKVRFTNNLVKNVMYKILKRSI